ncbi:MAG TPA: DinB family protein [Candidatus Limnocylindrales bacterium]|nr:DinB family protein [Candidatus Limnocylindrales bacterium]
MAHPLVDQLRFTRSEFQRGIGDTPIADGNIQLGPMNSIGWIVGHMAWHEQLYWLTRMQGVTPVPALDDLVATGKPATTPPLDEMLEAWRTTTSAADAWLDRVSQASLAEPLRSSPVPRTIGSALLRVTYHYWFHTGEILAIRQQLDHPDRPEFVGPALDSEHPYRPEAE